MRGLRLTRVRGVPLAGETIDDMRAPSTLTPFTGAGRVLEVVSCERPNGSQDDR